ncbi:AraC family ligand binding domain-containing protein [Shewanella sp. GXUN23E]|uniref:AraC family transcriptional regulator n=1 Tax=Shewanella sp. GXUN23E TaxID=3422498 RepID=UPI003D7EFD11
MLTRVQPMQEKMTYLRPGQLPGVEISQGHFRQFSFAPHVHLDFHIGVVTHGAQRYRHSGENLLLHPGKLATMNPDMVHTGESADAGDYVTKVLSLPVDWMTLIAREHGSGEWFFRCGQHTDPQLYHRFVTLHQQLSDPRMPTLALESALISLMADMMRSCGENRAEPRDYSLSSPALSRVIDRLHAHPGDDYQLQTLADIAGLGKYQLLRQFKQTLGITPFAYLQRLRLEHAKKRLHRNERLCDLACSLGFYDEAHLNKAFKQAFTVSPSAYRKAMCG